MEADDLNNIKDLYKLLKSDFIQELNKYFEERIKV